MAGRLESMHHDAGAIEAVLRAEREAEAEVEDVRRQVQDQLADAREQARRIAKRGDDMVARAHRRCAESADQAIAAMQREHAELQRAYKEAAGDDSRIEQAVREVVRWLLGEATA